MKGEMHTTQNCTVLLNARCVQTQIGNNEHLMNASDHIIWYFNFKAAKVVDHYHNLKSVELKYSFEVLTYMQSYVSQVL